MALALAGRRRWSEVEAQLEEQTGEQLGEQQQAWNEEQILENPPFASQRMPAQMY